MSRHLLSASAAWRAAIVTLLAVAVAATPAWAQPTAPSDVAPRPTPATAAASGDAAGGRAFLPKPPKVTAPAFLVYDGVDEELLAGRQTEQQRPIASLTKIMTALVVVERTKGTDMVTISRNATTFDSGSAIGMRAGQKYEVDTLLNAILVYSANDAAVALAEHVAGSEAAFVKLMNDRAKRLGLTQTTYTSATGLDREPLTVSTPTEVVEVARVALRDRRIARAVRMPELVVERPGTTPVTLVNRNPLITSFAGVDGMKTGMTLAAGYCLIAHYADAEGGSDIFTVVLGTQSEDRREADTRKLLEWARTLRPPVKVVAAGDVIGEAPVEFSTQRVRLFVSQDVEVNVRIGKEISERIVVPRLLEPPLREGDEVGTYEVLVDGEVVGSSSIFVEHAVREIGMRDQLRMAIGQSSGAWASGLGEVRRQLRSFAAYWGFTS